MLLKTNDLTKIYQSGLISREKTRALVDANITIDVGETVAVFGESGSGKTTLANLLVGELKATSGQIFWKDTPIAQPYRGQLRRDIQMLYQHPEHVFDPRWTMWESMVEPFRLHKIPYDKEKILELLSGVGLYEEHLYRLPATLSGGELQRMALARIMAISPKFIVLDEPTSMLDAISQAQILQILKDYQKANQTAYLLISHNKKVVEHMANRWYSIEKGHVEPGGTL